MRYKTKHDKQWNSYTPVEITPESAKRLMDNYYKAVESDSSKRNRAVNTRTVSAYAADMTAGKWKINSATIAFDEDGIIIDGQHRLLACIKSGCTIYSTISYNVPRGSFDTIDTGNVRTATQTMRIIGARYSSNLTAIIGGLRDFMVYMPQYRIYASKRRLTGREANEAYSANRAAYDASAEFASKYNRTKALSQKLLGVLHYYLINVINQDADMVNEFLVNITLDDTVPNTMENNLRKNLLALSHCANSEIYDRVRLAMIVRTWNALAEGKTKVRLPDCYHPSTLDQNPDVPQFISRNS